MRAPGEQPDPRCPRCGYDLSGQTATWTDACPLEGLCTECGLTIDWSEALGAAGPPPPWSVEHAPRRRVALTAFATGVRVIRPVRLFRRLQLHHPVRPVRLMLFVALLLLPGWLLWGVVLTANDSLQLWITRSGPATAPSLRSLRDAFLAPIVNLSPWTGGSAVGLWAQDSVLIGAMGMVAGLFAVTAVVRSARRPRVRAGHLLRIAALSLSPLALYALLGPLDLARAYLDAWAYYRRPPGAPEPAWLLWLTAPGVFWPITGAGRLITLAAFCAWATGFWAVAMRIGLRLERFGVVLLAASVTGLLLALFAAVYADPYALELLGGM